MLASQALDDSVGKKHDYIVKNSKLPPKKLKL